MELFAKLVNIKKPLTFFAKEIIDVCQSPKYTFGFINMYIFL